MKNAKLFLIGLALCVGVITSKAQGFYSFATPGTAIGTGTNYVIIPGESGAQVNNSQSRATTFEPIVTYYSARCLDNASSGTLASYISTNSSSCLSNSTTTIYVNSTNGFLAAAWYVIHHTANEARFADEAVFVTTLQNTNQLVANTTPLYTVAAGDNIYQETLSAATILTSQAASSTQVGPGIFTGQKSKPFLLLLTPTGGGAGTNTIDGCNATIAPLLP